MLDIASPSTTLKERLNGDKRPNLLFRPVPIGLSPIAEVDVAVPLYSWGAA